jgi:hypothetical protein
MELCYKSPNILCLTAVTLKDYVPLEDVADDRFLEETDSDIIYPYNKIPSVFTTLEKWPVNTNLHCWSCGFKFDKIPKFIPTYIRESDTIELGVMGNMCSFSCAELWIETRNISKEEKSKLQNNLCFLYYIFKGKHVAHIKPAPCKTNLLQYGGSWNEETFFDKIKELDDNIPINSIVSMTNLVS